MAKPKATTTRGLGSFFRTYWSWFLISAMLPVFVLAATGQAGTFSLFSRASGSDGVRVWAEPPTVIAGVSKPVTATVYIANDSGRSLLRTVNVTLSSAPGIDISPDRLEYGSPFSGTVTAGRVTVTAVTPGDYTVNITAAGRDAYGSPVPVSTSTMEIRAK